jgi:A/G-specific adenine glycosylase
LISDDLRSYINPSRDPDFLDRIRRELLQWYSLSRRMLPWRQTSDLYRIWVSETMLQQTRVETVLAYYEKFLKRFPTIRDLAAADLQSVLKIWEGMGYYARARNFHRAARIVVGEYQGEIPRDLVSFRKLPGVGEYIAAAVLSIAYNQPHAVVDGNVKRVLARLFTLDEPVNGSSHPVFKETAAMLLDVEQPCIFNQAVMELGAVVCRPAKPDCCRCPIRFACRADRTDRIDAYPKRIKKKSIPEHRLTAGIVYKKGRILITRRKADGLLGGLWEFPGGRINDKEDASSACRRNIREEVNLAVEIEAFFTRIKQAYTHFRIVLDVYRCRFVSGRVHLSGAADFRWILPEELEDYPFHSAHRKIIRLLNSPSESKTD